MRVAITMPNATHRLLKSKARSEGCTMRELVIRGILRELGITPPKGRLPAKNQFTRNRKVGVNRAAKP